MNLKKILCTTLATVTLGTAFSSVLATPTYASEANVEENDEVTQKELAQAIDKLAQALKKHMTQIQIWMKFNYLREFYHTLLVKLNCQQSESCDFKCCMGLLFFQQKVLANVC